MLNFKYKTIFATKHIRIIVPEEKSKQLALASLKDLKDVLPEGLDITGNPDLVFNSFNAAVVNRVNLNDDGIGTKDALAISNKFIHKPLDLEHNRKFVVGTVISQGYSEYLTNKMLTAEEVKDFNGPFNITLGGVVWSIFNPDFSEELIESSDETSPKYETISASWEMGFNDFHIALGSRDLAEAELITDTNQVKEFESLLRISNGSGKTKDGVDVFRIITGEALPLGVGYTTTPAAQVKGIIVAKTQEPNREVINLSHEKIVELCNSVDTLSKVAEAFSKLTQENIQKNEKNNSQVENITVKNNSNMKFKTLDDISADLFKDEATAAAATNFFGKYLNDELDKASTDYAEKLEIKMQEIAAKEKEAKDTQIKLDETLAEVVKVRADLKKEQDARAAQQAEADFNNRMTDLDSKFNLEDKDRSFVAKDIKGLDDASYATWFEKFEVYAAKKKKMDSEDDPSKGGDNGDDEDIEDAKKKKKAAKAAQEIKAAQEVLDKAKEDAKDLLPNNIGGETTLKNEFADAFKLEDFKFNNKK